MDPYERADIVSDQYDDWRVKNSYLMGYMNIKAGAFIETFKEWPPSQLPGNFTIMYFEEDVQKSMMQDMQKAKGAAPAAEQKK